MNCGSKLPLRDDQDFPAEEGSILVVEEEGKGRISINLFIIQGLEI